MSNKRTSGFSLIEIMVVIVIIGVTLTFAVLSFGTVGEKELCKKSAQKLSQFIGLSRQQAILSKKTLGVVVTQQEYYLQNPHSKSKELLNSPLLKHHKVSSKIQILISPLTKNGKTANIILQPTGEISLFKITFKVGDIAYYRLENRVGEVNLVELKHE